MAVHVPAGAGTMQSHPKLYFHAIEIGTHFLIPEVAAGLAKMKSRHRELELAPILEKNDGYVLRKRDRLANNIA